jgi:hypothetical protein
MSTVQPTDKVLVQRATTLHSAPADMSTVQDTDLLLINRAGVDYKCTFADWKASQVSVNKPALLTPADGATDVGETPTFTSSAFSATGSVTHASSDWQVTLKTDTAFASPVVQSMADTAHLLSWDGGPLQANTDYIARVRHNGSGGLQSPWSDAVGFKTKAAFVPVMKPGHGYRIALNTGILQQCSAPVKLVNIASGVYRDGGAVAAGVDGKMYVCPQARTTFTAYAPAAGASVVAVVAITDFIVNTGGCGWLQSDGIAVYRTSAGVNHASTEKMSAIGSFGAYNRLMWGIGVDGKAYFSGDDSYACMGAATSGWKEIPITRPSGESIKQIAAYGSKTNYNSDALLVLTQSGKLYAYSSSPPIDLAPGLPAAIGPTLVEPGVTFKEIATAGGCYTSIQGISALADNGDVYWACTNPSVTWGKFAAIGACRSPIFGGYADGNNDRFVLKGDGAIYWCHGTSTTFQKLDYATNSVPTTPITSLGSTPFSMGIDSTASFLLIPD